MVVVDCNAVVALALGTKEGEALATLALEGERFVAPDLIYSELAHVLEKAVNAGFISKSDLNVVAADALSFVDEVVPCASLWLEATSEALRLGCSSYDMMYFVLARRSNATLFTLDKRLQLLCLENGVDCTMTAAVS